VNDETSRPGIAQTPPHLGLGTVRERRAFVNIVETAARLENELDHVVRAATGLSLAQLDILHNVLESGTNGVRMSDLAGLLVVTPSGVTYRVRELEKRGLLRRDPAPEDQRNVLVTLTPSGLDLAYAAVPPLHDALRALVYDRLGDDEALDTLAALLDAICAPLRPASVVHRNDLR
jgi:DNA-binding MarR family transcriptional regulator